MAGVLRPALSKAGWKGDVKVHDFLVRADQALLTQASKEVGLESAPRPVAEGLAQSTYFFTFFFLPDRTLTLLGHPPQGRIVEALTVQGLPPKLTMAQEEMHGPGKEYVLWDFKAGSVASFPLDMGLAQALKASGMAPPGGAGP